MKRIAWILLLANLLVAAYFIGKDYWPLAESEKVVPINVDQLSLRSHSVPAPKQTSPPEAEALCVQWRGLTQVEFAQVREQLKAMVSQQVMSFSEVPLNSLRWVMFPPLPSAQSAMAKLSELAAAGVLDASVVKEGVWQNAISLGQYDNDEAAALRVRELESKGVLGTRIESLPQAGTDFYFVIRSEDPDVLKGLSVIKQAYPNSQQFRLACPS
jgi:hypothetical protein